MSNFSPKFKRGLAMVMSSALLSLWIFQAQASLMIMPLRTVFLDRDRMKTVTLVNTSTESAIFRMAFYNQTQLENGGYAKPDPKDPPQKYDLAKMLVFSPRQVELPPKGKQAVRISVRRPADLPDGEYRTHLKLERVAGQAQEKQVAAAKARGQKMALFMSVGFMVPVILRKGAYDTTVNISDFQFIPGGVVKGKVKPPSVSFKLNRKGKFSSLGRIEIYWRGASGPEKQVGIRNNVNIFVELQTRDMNIKLNDPNISGGKFRIVYQGEESDQNIKFDEKIFNG